MSKELTKKAVEMLLSGATMVSAPCPYCKGVRIIKDGNAFCVNCGKEGKNEKISEETPNEEKSTTLPIDRLDIKLKELANELEHENDYGKQQQIIRSINEIISIKEKLKKL
ncbi:MAG TPA: Sjogren's syndrome/scleroderma autoantigen 1 family protein [Candidatus Bathyarchaeia archaeon]|nr:Sjogren's syndrome/scleroderma autoantigen 1 family protein [Candidatus Bathyarchaeia archaeon]